MEQSGDRVTYAYDALDQLTKEDRAGANAHVTSYVYDQVGNRTKVEEAAGGITTITSYVYDVADQLASSATSDSQGSPVVTIPYNSDAAGNLVSGGGATNQWSVDNRLVKVTLQPGNVVTSLAYNADGLRVRKEDAGGVVKSIWDFQNVLMETDGAGAVQAVYTMTPEGYGILISQRRGSTSHYALYDALGSVIGLTDAAGALTDSYRYKAYGSILSSSGSTVNPFRWVGLLGYYYDASLGNYYIRARHYRVAIARWLSRDPLGYGASPWNLYRCASNSPLSQVDPSGLLDWGDIYSGFEIGGRKCLRGAKNLVFPWNVRDRCKDYSDERDFAKNECLIPCGRALCMEQTATQIQGDAQLLAEQLGKALGLTGTQISALRHCIAVAKIAVACESCECAQCANERRDWYQAYCKGTRNDHAQHIRSVSSGKAGADCAGCNNLESILVGESFYKRPVWRDSKDIEGCCIFKTLTGQIDLGDGRFGKT